MLLPGLPGGGLADPQARVPEMQVTTSSSKIFWFGLLVGGAPSFGSGAAALGPAIMGCLGFYAIYGIMAGATKRLDGKQREAYGGQPTFDAWVARTGGLFPKLADAGAAGQTTYNV